MDSISLYEWALSKAAGDRGGSVIGRTKSGKAIYASSHSLYDNLRSAASGKERSVSRDDMIRHATSAHPKFSNEDHANAAATHDKHIKDHGLRGDAKRNALLASDAHRQAWLNGMGKK